MKPASGNGEPIAKALRRATFIWQDRHEVFLNWAGLLAAFVLTCPAHTELWSRLAKALVSAVRHA